MVRQAVAGGHDVAALCRNPPPAGAPARIPGAEYFAADVTTGEGLAAALAGADVVIDCLEGRSGKALKNFADGGARLLAAAQDAEVARAVMLSIVNCDRSSFGYYASKAAKEQVYERSGLETVALRATQFHSLLATMFGAGSRLRIIPVVKGARFQPIAPADVASALLGGRAGTVGGPAAQRPYHRRPRDPGHGGIRPAVEEPSPAPADGWCGCRCPVPWATTCARG